MPRHTCTSTNKGMTLIEVLVVVFIITTIGGAVFALQTDVFTLNRRLSGMLETHDDARQLLRKFSSELRTTSRTGAGYPIEQAATSSITFYANVDNDAFTERVRYFLNGTTLRRGIIKPSGSPPTYSAASEQFTDLVDGIANGTTSIFTYYDASYAGGTSTPPLVSPAPVELVRLVKIELLIDHEPARPPGPTIFTTQVTPRNI